MTSPPEAASPSLLPTGRPPARHRAQSSTARDRLAGLWRAADRHGGRVIAAGGVLAALTFLIGLTRSPDFSYDEVLYSMAGQHVGNDNAIAFAVAPILVHPPLFFLAVSGWLALTGHLHSPVVDAIHTARYLNVAFDVALVCCIGGLARAWTAGRDPVVRGRATVAAMALAALNPFLLRFGRQVLIEPMAVLLGTAAVLCAWRLRSARAPLYVSAVGGVMGLALLVKEPTLFIVLTPLLASALRRDGRGAVRDLLALAVAAVVWAAFPLWAAAVGEWSAFYDTQTFSIRRLLGLVQVTGLNRPGVSKSQALIDTLPLYVGAYLAFAAGGLVLAGGLVKWLRSRARLAEAATAYLLALGLATYGFLVFSVVAGQSNEQLTVYTVPAAALLVAGHRMVFATSSTAHRVARGVIGLAIVGALLTSLVSWLTYFVVRPDNATARVEAFLRRTYPPCVSVNATGDAYHWAMTLRTQRVTGFARGKVAVQHGVHVFLTSPKDARLAYGASSRALNYWIAAHGRKVFSVPSTTSGNISVWEVGRPRPAPGAALPYCAVPLPVPDSPHASATRFLAVGGGLVGIDALCVVILLVISSRRRQRDDRTDERDERPAAAR